MAEIHSKENIAIANIKTLFEIMKNLPAKQRNIESQILNEILQIRPKRLGVNEIIEINDDDSTTTKRSESWNKVPILILKLNNLRSIT